MKNRLKAALSGVAFFVGIGIVGAVENGAPLSRLWWVFLPLTFLALATRNTKKFPRAQVSKRIHPRPARNVE